ncbi:hypothetical protein CCACVL1_17114 [Corchorus capsularis]|uniref:DUF4378 domain-containing protein n=1 Tax=Corchorus capsularis TaxID=210143 RepID=A0A1R3HU38_COCAP|nr:hypothetical protein CCACVL1_17114 [Corchorus capsularis]
MTLLSARIVKSIVYKLNSATDSQELSCCSDKALQDELQTAETDGFAEMKKGLTRFGDSPCCIFEDDSLPSKHCRPSPASDPGNVEEKETLTLTDKTWQKTCSQEKHLNLMSLLNKLSSEEVHNIITRQETLTTKARGNLIFTTSPWKSFGKSLIERYSLIGFKEAKEIVEPCSPQRQRNKDLVNQRKPLLNLAKKSIINNDMKKVRNKYNYIHWFIAAENLGNLMTAQQTYSCRKISRESSMDFSNTVEEWNYSQKLQRKISFELGDTIMDDIVEEMIDLLWQYAGATQL